MHATIIALALTLTPASAFVSSPTLSRRQTRASLSLLQALKQPKDDMKITLLPGDGIGPEIMSATVGVLEALAQAKGFKFSFQTALIGGAALDATGDPFPPATLASCQGSDSVLLACIGGPKWDSNPRNKRPETGLLAMRKQMGLFANLRPATVKEGRFLGRENGG